MLAATRDPRAYQLKKAQRAESERRAAKDKSFQITTCYEQYNPPQIRFGLEMLRTCAKL